MTALADSLRVLVGNKNVVAFLRMIREGESSQDDAAYFMRWPGKTFDDLSKHPRIFEPGPNGPSSAAGCYQITATTYDDFAPRLGIHDFSRESQTLIALAIIHAEGALPDILDGRVVDAIQKLGGRWASLPSSTSGQPTQKLAHLLDVYAQWGGTTLQAPGGDTSASVRTPPPTAAGVPAPYPRESTDDPFPVHLEEPPMAPALLAALIQTAATVIPELATILMDKDKPTRVRNVEAATVALRTIAEATKPADVPPPQWNAQDAVQAILVDPAAAAKARAAILDAYERLLGMVVRAQEADTASMDRAAARVQGDDVMNAQTPTLIVYALRGMGMVVLLVIALMGAQIWLMPDHKPQAELLVLFVGIVSSWLGVVTTIYAYRFGSSAGSKASGDAVRAIAESRR